MKKLSLSNLSRINLSKMQEQAIIGGSSDSCICASLCTNCDCNGVIDAENFADDGMEVDLDVSIEERAEEDIM